MEVVLPTHAAFAVTLLNMPIHPSLWEAEGRKVDKTPPPLARFLSVGHGQPNGYMPGGHVFGTLPTNFLEPPFHALR